MNKQPKRLEAADEYTFRLLLGVLEGAEPAVEALEKRLALIRSWPKWPVDAEKALTEALPHLRQLVKSLDQSLEAEVQETGKDGRPFVCLKDREGMYSWVVYRED